MREPPRDRSLDSTLALVREGYEFASNRRMRLGSDAFTCRLIFKKAIFIGGPDAARLFYDTDLFRRRNVAPSRIENTLLGKGGIHGLDGPAHRHRKALYLALLGPERLERFRDILGRHWRKRTHAAAASGRVEIFAQAQIVLLGAVCEWAGIPLEPDAIRQRADDLTAMVDAFGGIGWRNWRGRWARRASERWMRGIVDAVRQGALRADPTQALGAVAAFRDRDGSFLNPHVAAVELLNIVRPAMAIPYFIEFAAAALQAHPAHRASVASDDEMLECFVQEVRRYYPFTPFLGAESCTEIAWQGFRIPAGTLVVLDVYGIHRDDRVWPHASVFDPLRFRGWTGHPFTLLQQGGGAHDSGHRCPGEWLTIEALKLMSRELAKMNDRTASPSLRFDLRRIPARLPHPVTIEVPSTSPEM